MRSIQKTAVAAMIAAFCHLPQSAEASLIADSVIGFSGVQGQGGWYYGYDVGTGFIPMPTYGVSGDTGYWSSGITLGYPYIYSWGQIPCTADYTGINAWAIRRWVSGIEADITIDGLIQRLPSEPYNVGDGFLAMVSLNQSYRTSGTFLTTQHVAAWDYTEYLYELNLHVSPGDTIDFMTGSYSTTWGDNGNFTALITGITSIPEPASLVALGGLLGSGAFLRIRRQPA